MARCAAPLRSVLAGTRFAPPRRRLISTVTGRPVMPGEDLAELLAGQLSQPVLFAQAMALAAEHADLIVVAGPDDGLADLAAGLLRRALRGHPGRSRRPGRPGPGAAAGPRGDRPRGRRACSRPGPSATWRAPGRRHRRRRHRWSRRTVPRMRDGESTGPRTAVQDSGQEINGAGTTVRSG